MLQEMKQQSVKKVLVPSIISLILAAVLLFFSVPDIAKFSSKGVNLYDLKDEEIKDQYIDSDISFVYGVFAERYNESNSGVTRTTFQYYVIPVGEESYMAIKVPARRISEMDAQVDLTYDYLDEVVDTMDTSYHITGMINPLEDEEYELLEEFFEDSGFSKSEIRKYVLPYVLEEGEGSIGSSVVSWLLFGIGAVLLIYAVYSLIRAFTGGYQKKVVKFLNTQGTYAQEQADTDYQSAQKFGKVRFGRRYFFYAEGRYHKIVPIDDIIWVYQLTTTHRTNGIKTGTTYSIVIYTNSSKKSITVPCGQDICAEILQYCHNTYPHMVTGFSQELQNCFKKDRAAFLNIAYNPAKAAANEADWNPDQNNDSVTD